MKPHLDFKVLTGGGRGVNPCPFGSAFIHTLVQKLYTSSFGDSLTANLQIEDREAHLTIFRVPVHEVQASRDLQVVLVFQYVIYR